MVKTMAWLATTNGVVKETHTVYHKMLCNNNKL